MWKRLLWTVGISTRSRLCKGEETINVLYTPVPITALQGYSISQLACGETFTIFVGNKNELIVTGMLETSEEVFDLRRTQLAIPHIVPFQETILKVAAGTRFALVGKTNGSRIDFVNSIR